MRKLFLVVLMIMAMASTVFAGSGSVDWDKGYIDVIGLGVPPSNATSPAQAAVMARRAAVVDAYRNVSECIAGIALTSETTVRDAMVESDIIKTKVSAFIKGAKIINEQKAPDGTYQVTMRIPLYGIQGLEAAFPQINPNDKEKLRELNQPKSTVQPTTTPVPQTNPTPAVVEGVFGRTAAITGKELTGNVYFLPEDTSKLPDFSRLTPVGKVYASSLNIPERHFDQGFPGISDRFEWFALAYDGSFIVNKPGRYVFTIKSDDGSKLYIDGNLVINNDGVHPTSEHQVTVDLSSGTHTIRVEYFQGPRYYITLQLFVAPEGGEKVILNVEKPLN